MAYFSTWATAERTQRIYNADFRAAAAWLDANAQDEPVYMGTDRLLDLDQLTYGFYEPRRIDANWFLLPDSPALPAEGSALYLLPASTKLPATLDALSGILARSFLDRRRWGPLQPDAGLPDLCGRRGQSAAAERERSGLTGR